MAETPRFGVRFKRPTGEHAPIYRHAVDFAARAHEVIEAADGERFFLRDQLDRKASMIPQLIAQGLAVADMAARRQLFRHARRALTDCTAILDMVFERGSAPGEVIAPARDVATALLDELLQLTVEPPKQW